MRVRKVPALLVGVGLAAVCAVNVAAAAAQPAEPGFRIPFVDPYAVAADGSTVVDGSGAASWRPGAAPQVLADPAQAAPDEPAASAPATDGDAGATPLSNEVAAAPVPQVQLPRTLEQWVTAVSSATGIPAPAVRAYGDATLVLADEDSGCRLGWPTLAGIGWIESGHGTHGHATLGDDGVPSIPIVGPALDGSPGRAAIRSTAQSAVWHGDAVWDHAVGPMQFIPSTWVRWGADGDGDGVANPQDIDDAALAAARYLCAGSRDLSTWDGWHAAVLSYNHSEAYVQSVYTRAGAYATAAGR